MELAADAHSTTDGQVLRAEQIIEHHNSVLGIFGEVKPTYEIQFLEDSQRDVDRHCREFV